MKSDNLNNAEPNHEGQFTRWQIYIGMPVMFVVFAVCVLTLPKIVLEEVVGQFYLPFANQEPVVLLSRSGTLAFTMIPSALMILLLPLAAFIKYGMKVDFSPYQRKVDQYGRIFCYVTLVGLALPIPVNLYLAGKIADKGYISCNHLSHFGLARRITGYVLDPMLCVSEKNLPRALERYEQQKEARENPF